TPGVTLFGGPDKSRLLNFYLQSGRAGDKDRYKLRIPADKLNLAVELISISYPDYYKGKFNPEKIEVRIKDEPIALEEVIWDPENHFIEIYPAEPIPAGTKIEIVMSDVKNPTFGGMYQFNANIRTPGDVPITRYVGTWVLNIN
ncbi:MAG: DUF2808 domain-containing protein, partial [Oscillatoriales cyanobacterium RM1_1_9]|nr:DUF2808 domain-containing protein [Oscillatoriales cyanobacterium RM1_1_9]